MNFAPAVSLKMSTSQRTPTLDEIITNIKIRWRVFFTLFIKTNVNQIKRQRANFEFYNS